MSKKALALCLFLTLTATPALSQMIVAPAAPEAAAPAPDATATPAAIPASGAEPLTVENIMIDKQDKNAVVARDAAIVLARRTAFQKLAERSMTPDQLKTLAVPSDDVLMTLVKDFEIKGEQMSSDRYIASFTVRFNDNVANYISNPAGPGVNAGALVLPEGTPQPQPAIQPPVTLQDPDATIIVSGATQDQKAAAAQQPQAPLTPEQQLLDQKNKPPSPPPFVEIRGQRDVLVLPYFLDIAGRKLLWEDPNPWRDAWQAHGNTSPSDTLTITVPTGDLNDVNAGSTTGIWSGDYSTLESLKTRYNASEVVVALAMKSGIQTRIEVYDYRNGKLERWKDIAPFNIASEDANSFQNTIRMTIDVISKPQLYVPPAVEKLPDINLKGPPQKKLPPPKPAEPRVVKIEISMGFQHFTHWLEIQRRLTSIAPQPVVDIMSLTKNAVRFTVAFNGTMSEFKAALDDKGLMLVKPSVEVNTSTLDKLKPEILKPETSAGAYEIRVMQWP